jgi:hypothetical protein
VAAPIPRLPPVTTATGVSSSGATAMASLSVPDTER